MNRSEFDFLLLGIGFIGAAIAVLNLARIKQRGPRSFAMAIAGLSFGGAALAYRAELPMFLVYLLGVTTFVGLCGDAYFSFRQEPKK